MRGFKSIFVSSKYKINRFLIQEKYFRTANAVDTLPLIFHAPGPKKCFLFVSISGLKMQGPLQLPPLESGGGSEVGVRLKADVSCKMLSDR